MTENELKIFVGKPAWFNGSVLEIRKSSDAEITAVEGGYIVLKHLLFGHVSKIPVSEVTSLKRKDI